MDGITAVALLAMTASSATEALQCTSNEPGLVSRTLLLHEGGLRAVVEQWDDGPVAYSCDGLGMCVIGDWAFAYDLGAKRVTEVQLLDGEVVDIKTMDLVCTDPA
ncbi:MAG: hypothetical protein AAGK37_06875 [Pseudomonadota bacterium]